MSYSTVNNPTPAAPARLTLQDVNLEAELLEQYTLTSALLSRILEEDDIPPNQKAQVINSCTGILEKISKLQIELYGSERIKRLEKIFINLLRELPNPEVFLDKYERAIRSIR